MLYAEPIFRMGGDSFITAEFGDDGSLSLNLYVLSVERKILHSEIPGLIDTTALRTTIMVHYDPFVIRGFQLIALLRELVAAGIDIPELVPSRVVQLPVHYNDPWTRECAKEFGVRPNLEIIAEDNAISLERVIEIHSQPTYFVSYISFMFGSFGAFPIDPPAVLKTSKYKVPRKWTPEGTLGVGGTTTAFYSVDSPGGIMMLGRVPVKTFDLDGQCPFFKENPLLFRPGDRIRFLPIESAEYDYVKKNRDDYDYQIEDGWIESTKYRNLSYH